MMTLKKYYYYLCHFNQNQIKALSRLASASHVKAANCYLFYILLWQDNCSGEDEVVAASLPKSLSATSSSIEAVSMDEDDTPGTFHKLVCSFLRYHKCLKSHAILSLYISIIQKFQAWNVN